MNFLESDHKKIEKIFVKEVQFVFSNTGDNGFNINKIDNKSEFDQSKSFPGKLLDLLYARYLINKKTVKTLAVIVLIAVRSQQNKGQ